MVLVTLLFVLIACSYYLVILYYFFGLGRLKYGSNTNQFSIAVIVPARNEEKNISKCLDSLLSQDYPQELYQIYVIDDHSTDRTIEIVQAYQQIYPKKIQLHKIEPLLQEHLAYKKYAIQAGIKRSQSDLILTIDADCWARPTWLSASIKYFEKNVGMVCGFVVHHTQKTDPVFYHLQALEFLGIVTASAGSLGMGSPITSNGANLAYRRNVFEEVDGFTGIDKLPSGDDDLLMHKIHKQTNWKIRFAFEKNCINYTNPEPTFKQFLNQRTRWASKSTHYVNKNVTYILSVVYLFYLYLFLGIVYSLVFNFHYLPFLLFLAKCLFEFLVVVKGCKTTGKQDLIKYFPMTQFFQILYILIVGFRGVFGKYNWKGRQTKNYFGLNHNSSKDK